MVPAKPINEVVIFAREAVAIVEFVAAHSAPSVAVSRDQWGNLKVALPGEAPRFLSVGSPLNRAR